MFRNGIADGAFQAAVEPLRVPGMGTEVVAPILAHLIHMTRPTRVLEVGMGYTTPFLAQALLDVEESVAAERKALVEKTEDYLREGRQLDEAWIEAEPALLVPGYYRSEYQPRFVAVDDLSDATSSAPRVQEILGELGLRNRVEVINARLRECAEALPADFEPIDFAWVDAWDCLYFFENFLDRVNPDGGLVAFHYLMTYPEGEAILQHIAGRQRMNPGEFEVLSLLESQKIRQNSLTVIRRTSGLTRRQYFDFGQRARLGSPVLDDSAAVAASLTISADRETPTPA